MSSNFRCKIHPNYVGIYPPRKDRDGHVCEMCDWVWHASPHFHDTAPRRPWNHGESTFPLGKGGANFGEYLKQKAMKVVRVVTDDAEIPFGLLIRDDEDNQIRVGHPVSVPKFDSAPQNDMHLNQRRRLEWRLDAISRDRISELRVLS